MIKKRYLKVFAQNWKNYNNFIINYLKKFFIANPRQKTETNGLNLSPIIQLFLINPENPELKLLILDGQILPRYVLKHIKRQIRTSKESKLNNADILI